MEVMEGSIADGCAGFYQESLVKLWLRFRPYWEGLKILNLVLGSELFQRSSNALW
jgi:hypothetical protein